MESPNADANSEITRETDGDQHMATGRGQSSPHELAVVPSRNRLSVTGLVPGITVRAVGGMVGLAGLGLGYGMAKLMSSDDLSKSKSVRLGLQAMLYTNGIFPTVLCEDDAGGYQVGTLPEEDDQQQALLRSTPLLVANHVSYIDAVMLPLVLQMPKFMSMAEVRSWPVFGSVGEDLDYIWVDRNCPESRQKSLKAIDAHVQGWSPGRRPLLIFPEGTTSNGTGLHEFRKGAFAAGKPVRPVVVKYTGSWNPANVSHREACDSSPEDQEMMVQTNGHYVPYGDGDWAAQFAGHLDHTCLVLICRAYHPSPEEQADPVLYAKNVRDFMLERLHELNVVSEGSNASNIEERLSGLRRHLRMKKSWVNWQQGEQHHNESRILSLKDATSSSVSPVREKLRARAQARKVRLAMRAMRNFKLASSETADRGFGEGENER